MKHKIDSFYLISKLEQHEQIKQQLLKDIETAECGTLDLRDKQAETYITKVDWGISSNWNRPWVLNAYPPIKSKINQMLVEEGYEINIITQFWFQQYVQSNYHDWHIHSGNFVGVYYAELHQESPITELVDPWDKTSIIKPDVEEGDIILFPAHIVHRAPFIKNDKRKTIVSWNMDLKYGEHH